MRPGGRDPARGRDGEEVVGEVDEDINVGPVPEVISILVTAVYEPVLEVPSHHVMADQSLGTRPAVFLQWDRDQRLPALIGFGPEMARKVVWRAWLMSQVGRVYRRFLPFQH